MKEYKELIPEITLKFKKGNVHMVQVKSSIDSFNLFKLFYDEDTVELCESAIVIFLNRANKSIGWYKVSQGGLCSTVVDIKLILATALKCGASSVILSHNHPSGGTTPSINDNDMTRKLKIACNAIDLVLLDHIIVNDTLNRYYSYADESCL